MTARIVILYGPPASGKSTITHRLHDADSRFALFPRLKAGSGRKDEYRLTTIERIADLQASGDVIWTNERYGSTYAIDRSHLDDMISRGLIPVLHAGQRAAVEAIAAAVPDAQVTTVSLTVPRDVGQKRIADRATGDSSERFTAFDTTEEYGDADLVIDTANMSPSDAASTIIGRVIR
jgi:guanylate kinase